ncbi:hypothetical protein FV139_07335 [Parahaliea maris]|uniref:Lipoprotein n=1 Tax=Parahaliea maris TaxID=2716870 RepID=A0A5C9A6N8_9GAMM|nr:hypothetical protein [Parahaliea maris]TXS95674.1 hypothetical protein FV139_07335 [Parahaliea maris]
MKPLLYLWLAMLAACASPTPEVKGPDPLPAQSESWPPPVGAVVLDRVPVSDEEALDVGLSVFDPGLAEDVTSHGTRGIFPDIRRAEVRYLPVLLRQALVESGAWGVVRVLPEADPTAEVQVGATILHSDGERLVLRVTARDAAGRVWLDGIYTDVATAADYPVAAGGDPFADLYRQVANDLLAARGALPASELRQLGTVSELRYAASLAPEAFSAYVATDSDGIYQVQRLPADNDPMLLRIGRLREQEYRFIDTVDEQYLDLLENMRPTYDLWRQYGREQAEYIADYHRRLQDRDSAGRRGSYAALEQTYNTFRWSKIQQQDLQELAEGFDNEVTPTVMDVSGRVFRLSGNLGAQYQEWRDILRQIFALETGLPVGDGGG